MDREGVAEMFCIAGVGGNKAPCSEGKIRQENNCNRWVRFEMCEKLSE